MKRSVAVALATAFSLAGCATVHAQTTVSRPAQVATFVSVGDVMLRVAVRESLPNAFGRADIFGRTRDRGFSEIRYMGLGPNGAAIFRRRDVDIVTNETTMNTTGFRSGTVTAQPMGQGVIASGIGLSTPRPNVSALPPDTTEFALDLSQGRIVTIREKRIEILEATSGGVRFVVR